MTSGFLITFSKNHEKQAVEEFKSLLSTGIRANVEIPDFDLLLNQTVKQSWLHEIKIDKLNQIKIFKALGKIEVLPLFKSFDFGTIFIHRIIPLAIITSIKEYQADTFDYLCSVNKMNVRSYKILYESRLCDNFKDEIFAFVLNLIQFEVNLKQPEYLLVIQVCKNIVGISFIKNRKFNFKEER